MDEGHYRLPMEDLIMLATTAPEVDSGMLPLAGAAGAAVTAAMAAGAHSNASITSDKLLV